MIELTILNITLRLILAMVLGGLLGIERTVAGKMAGLRTYALVSLGSALFVVISQLVIEQSVFWGTFDPLRVASQVLVGIGFIGAGLVIYKDSKLTGLTTAAGLWLAAGVGLACGFGLVDVAIVATMLGLLILILWFVERPFQEKEINHHYD